MPTLSPGCRPPPTVSSPAAMWSTRSASSLLGLVVPGRVRPSRGCATSSGIRRLLLSWTSDPSVRMHDVTDCESVVVKDWSSRAGLFRARRHASRARPDSRSRRTVPNRSRHRSPVAGPAGGQGRFHHRAQHQPGRGLDPRLLRAGGMIWLSAARVIPAKWLSSILPRSGPAQDLGTLDQDQPASAVVGRPPQIVLEHLGQVDRRQRVRPSPGPELVGDLSLQLVDDGVQQGLLGRKVVVERALGHPARAASASTVTAL